MNPREFKTVVDSSVQALCERLGFKKDKSTTSRWILPRKKEFLFYEIAKGVKHPFIPGLGGQFLVTVHVLSSPDHRKRTYENAISYLKYFTDGDLEKHKKLSDSVLRKLMAQESPDKFTAVLIDTEIPLWEMQLNQRVHRTQPHSLPYLDREDMLAWGDFLASRLEQTVEGIFSTPDRSFSQGP
jgi:hypothetical protein